jgi:hypothetical protein
MEGRVGPAAREERGAPEERGEPVAPEKRAEWEGLEAPEEPVARAVLGELVAKVDREEQGEPGVREDRGEVEAREVQGEAQAREDPQGRAVQAEVERDPLGHRSPHQVRHVLGQEGQAARRLRMIRARKAARSSSARIRSWAKPSLS